MSEPLLVTVDNLAKGALEIFLSRMYPPAKTSYLQTYGSWQHQRDQNRWVILVDGQIAAYCAVIPTRCWIEGREYPAIWWVDLIVDPQYRGRGLQTLFDQQIRQMADLKVGFPNELAAKIHRKHGWGVREDYKLLLLPLIPLEIRSLRRVSGWRGLALRAVGLALTPWSALLRWRHQHYRPVNARKVENPSPELLAGVFERYRDPQTSTTYRDSEHFRWRYLDSPLRNEYAFYTAGPQDAPTHYLIARHMNRLDAQGTSDRITRLLDVYGDFQDATGLKDMLCLAIRDAIRHGANQVTSLSTLPEITDSLRSLGFLAVRPGRFCWHSTSPELMNALDGRNHWTMGDSDNDEPG